ncbi:MAG: 50S ribosomal protein L9 [Firmicutes bacterium ADurb.Bin506]|nr:MAG: 50S ribosomal protein L9 [Firmicutes bacterium ADurb.Bin506]
MKVVLQKDVPGLGKKDTAVEVAEGYARNYLIPRGLALAASSGQLKRIEELRDAERRREAKEEAKARENARKLKSTGVTIKAKAGDAGRLYGSITAKDVAEAISQVIGVAVDRRKIELHEPIREIGEHIITVRVHPGVSAEVCVKVVPE